MTVFNRWQRKTRFTFNRIKVQKDFKLVFCVERPEIFFEMNDRFVKIKLSHHLVLYFGDLTFVIRCY